MKPAAIPEGPAVVAVGEAVPMRFKKWYIPDRDKSERWKEEAKEDFDFVAGRQYSDDELKVLNRPGRQRPAIAFNRIQPIIDSVTGFEVGNRRQVRYIPRQMGGVKANELLTSAGEWFRDEAKGDFADSAAFASTVICGMGWTESRLNLKEGPKPKPVVEEIDWAEMAWDAFARGRNLKDARRVWRVRRVPIDEAQAEYPGFTKAELHAGWTAVNSEADLFKDTISSTSDDEMVTIVQCQWVETENYHLAEDPTTGQQAEFSDDEFKTANARLKQVVGMEMQSVTFSRKVRKQAFFGEVVLAYGPAPCNEEFSLQCITGKFDRNKGTWYGMVRGMKDPQRWANKWLSQMMHIMNSNAKGGIMAEKGVFANSRKAQEEWSSPDAITEVNVGAIEKIKEKPQAQFPVGFQQLTEFAISSIRDVSGVSVELLGMRSADQAASLEMQRRQAGMTILQPLFDGLKLYRELQGRVILYYLQHDIPDGTLIRIVGQDEGQYVPLMKQADVDYDIIVDDAPSSPNQKEQIWAIISTMLPMVGKIIPPQFLLKALKYSPLPSTVVAELEQMANAPNPQAQEEAATRAKAAAAQVDKTLSEAALNKAKAASAMQPDGTANADPAAAAEMTWRLALLDALTKLEVARITAKTDNDSAMLDAQIEAFLHITGMQSDQVMQLRAQAHDRAVAATQPPLAMAA